MGMELKDLECMKSGSEDLEECRQTRPMKTAGAWVYFQRFMGSPCEMDLSSPEKAYMKKRFPHFGPMARRVMAWRASTLCWATFFFLIVAVLKAYKFYTTYTRNMTSLPTKGFLQYVVGTYRMEVLLHGLIFLGTCAAFVCSVLATYFAWTSPRMTRYFVFLVCMFGYCPVFLGFLLIPFSSGTDVPGLTHDVCMKAIHGDPAAEFSSTASGFEYLEPVFKRIAAGHGLTKELKHKFSIDLPPEFDKICLEDPKFWEDALSEVLRDLDLSVPPGGTSCPAADKLTVELNSTAACPANCPAMCFLGGECEDMLPHLALLSDNAAAQLEAKHVTSSPVAGPLGRLAKCFACVKPCVDCLESCVGCLSSAVPLSKSICLSAQDLHDFQLLISFAKDAKDLKYLVNLRFALEAFETLLPNSLAFLEGTQYGGKIAKLIFSYSRMPGFLMAAATVFTLPTACAIFSLLTGLLGNLYVSFGFLALLAAYSVFLPVVTCTSTNFMSAATYGDANAELSCRFYHMYAFKTLFLCLIIVFFTQHGLTSRDLKALNTTHVAEMLTFMILNALLDYFAKSRTTYLAFTDAISYVGTWYTEEDRLDDGQLKELRRIRSTDLASFYYTKNDDAYNNSSDSEGLVMTGRTTTRAMSMSPTKG